MSEVVGTAYVELKLDDKPYAQSMKSVQDNATRAATGIEQSFVKSGVVMGAAMAGVTMAVSAAVAVFRKLKGTIEEATMLTARVETLGVVLGVVGKNIGLSKGEMEAYAVGIRKMGITTKESYDTVIKMAQAKINLAESTKLARVAQDAAVIGDLNSSQAMQRLIWGISTQQTEILRTMGLNVRMEQAMDKYAKSINKTVKELTQQERQQAIVNAVYEAAVNIQGAYEASMTTAMKQIKSMERYVEELKLKFGELFGGALTAIVFLLVDKFKEWEKILSSPESVAMIERIADTLEYGVRESIESVKDLFLDVWGILEPFSPLLELIGGLISKSAEGIGLILAGLKPVSNLLGIIITQAINFVKALFQGSALLANLATGNFEGAAASYAEFKGTLGKMGESGKAYRDAQGNLAHDTKVAIGERQMKSEENAAKIAASRSERAEQKKEQERDFALTGRRSPKYKEEEMAKKDDKGAENAAEQWEKKYREMQREIDSLELDKYERKQLELAEKYANYLQDAEKAGKKGYQVHKEKIDLWYREMTLQQEILKMIDEEYKNVKNLNALRRVEIELDEKTFEIESQIAEFSGKNLEDEKLKRKYEKEREEIAMQLEELYLKIAMASADEVDSLASSIDVLELKQERLGEIQKKEEELLGLQKERNRMENTVSILQGVFGYEKDYFYWRTTQINDQVNRWRAAGVSEVHITQRAVKEIKAAYVEAFKDSSDFLEGLNAAYIEIQENMITQGRFAYETVTNLHGSIKQSFVSVFADIRNNEMKTFGEYFADFLEKIATKWEDMLSEMLANWILTGQIMKENGLIGGTSKSAGGLGSIFDWIFGTATGSTGMTAAEGLSSTVSEASYFGIGEGMSLGTGAFTFHSGGDVSGGGVVRNVDASLFDHAPRLHKGLRAGEFPAILEYGEEVKPKGDKEESDSGQNYFITINAIDSQSFADIVNRNPGIIVSVIDTAMKSNSTLRQTMKRTR